MRTENECCACVQAVAETTAELGLSLMLAASRNIVSGNRRARQRVMDPGWFGRTMAGSVLGVVGMGDIGGRVAAKAAAAFGMKVQYSSRKRKPAIEAKILGGATFVPDLTDLCKAADIIVVCVALTAETTHMFKAEHFAAMKSSTCAYNRRDCWCSYSLTSTLFDAGSNVRLHLR